MVVDPRWRTVLTVAPYLVLAMLVAFTGGIEWGAWSRLVPDLVLCAAYGLWILVLRDLPLPFRGSRARIPLLVSGLIALNLALVVRDSWCGFLTIATFTIAYSLVPWPWELLAVGTTAAVSGIAQSSSFARDGVGIVATITVIAVNIVVMCGLSWGLRLAQRQMELTATEAERSRLAREIHDTLAQGFAGIVTQLQAAEQAPDDADRRRHTDAAIALARDGLAEARRSVRALRPVALDGTRLTDAVAHVARDWSRRSGIPVHVRADGLDRPLPTDAEVALLRTAQEALVNIERHARAHRVDLVIRYGAHEARLEIRDDGEGFDPARPRPDGDGGFGLVAMRERIEAVAGALVVESEPGRGTAIRAEVPA